MNFSTQTTNSDNDIALFVFIDAMGWRIFQNHQESFLADQLQLAQPLDTVLGYSCSCDPTILTGSLPQEHGHFSFFQFAPERSPFQSLGWLRWLPKWVASRGRVRRQLSKWLAHRLGYTGYFQLYNARFDRLPWLDYSEKRDLYEPNGILSGQPTIFDFLRRENIPFHVSDWRRSEQTNIDALKADLEAGQIRWGYLYLAGLDAILHRDGTEATTVADHIRWYDEQLRHVLATARRRYNRVRMYLFSDHGMTNVTSTSALMIDIEALAERHDLRFGRDYGAVYDSTMARFWFKTETARETITAGLAQRGDGRILTDQQLQGFGCLFADRQYGELFFLLEPGVLLCPSDMGERPLRGMHGYTPEHPDSAALIASTETLVPPARLDGIYSMMLSEAERCCSTPRSRQLAGPVLT